MNISPLLAHNNTNKQNAKLQLRTAHYQRGDIMSDKKYYFCEHCGNLVDFHEKEANCCGKKMKQILDGVEGASKEKHAPSVTINGNSVTVSVGNGTHPMTKEHLIEWVYLKTDNGRYIKYLDIDKKPSVTFSIKDEKPLEVCAYCNQHGLWKAEM